MALRGMSLIDVVVGSAIMLVVFLGIFGAFQLSIELVFSTKAKTGAVSLLTERMEYIRSISYADVGTVGGIPSGTIPQLEQQSLNGITYTVRTLIQYEDAPEDGLDDDDENGITADYKSVKVEVLWSVKQSSRSTFAVTRVSPVGEESLEGGGTLRVNVFDAGAQPIQGAMVHIVNDTTDPAIDVSVQTNAAGRASFPGAPEASEYEITVTKDEYSSAQTYAATAQNPNPSPSHVSVAESETTTVGLAIDELGELRVYTYEPQGEGMFHDTFSNQSQLIATSSVEVQSGALALAEDPDFGYAASGNAFSVPITPSYLVSWDEILFAETKPLQTSLSLRVYYFDGSVFTLVPDEDLPENSAGFTESPIDISPLNTATYASLQLGAFLETADASSTPELMEWQLSYTAGPTPLGGVDFDIRGTKTIGTDSLGQPIYKFEESNTTTQYGEWFFIDHEWGTYDVTLPGSSPYDIVERCPNTVSLSPGVVLPLSLWLEDKTARSLRVVVESNGAPVSGASVAIAGPQSANKTASACGQAFFSGLTSGTYTLTVTHSGYQPYSEDIGVSGTETVITTLTPN